jgi:hypothetical protein
LVNLPIGNFIFTKISYVIIILYSFISFANGLQWVTFAPVANKLKQFYGINSFEIDLFSMIYMIIYPLANFPSSYIVDNKSAKLGV